ncbi:PAS-domain containing protein [Palleronia sp.]|uniref:PAS-domain containing protein n=1 Tax=Palleronia sp. TaxID=1940284 RepID=UPI0035C7F955
MRSDNALEIERERRGRLAAERTFAQRERELTSRIAKLEATSRRLTQEIETKRREAARLDQSGVGRARDIKVVRSQPDQAEHPLWAALQTIPDGFALFDKDSRLILANPAYLAIFDGLTAVAPGVSYDQLCDLLVLEGVVDAAPDYEAWRARMKDRWQQDEIPPEVLRIFDGRFIKLVDRRLPDGGVVTLAVDQTQSRRLLSALDALPEGFVVFDADDKIVTANEAYLNLVGLNRDDLRPGTTPADLFHGAARPEHEGSGAEEICTADGRRVRLIAVALPDGGRAGLSIDVTAFDARQTERSAL